MAMAMTMAMTMRAYGLRAAPDKAPDVITAPMVNALIGEHGRLERHTEASWAKVARRAQIKVWRRLEEARLSRRAAERRAWAVLEEEARVARLGLEPVA